MVHAQADDAPIENVDNAMLEQLGEVSAAVRAEEARRLAAARRASSQARGIDVELVASRRPAGRGRREVATRARRAS